jgi:enamine deaminase RidA (YjgF/YER057c/UK114 family)
VTRYNVSCPWRDGGRLDFALLKQEHDMTKRDAIFPAGRQALYEINQYSAAIRSGDLLFVSGQVGSREDGSPEPEFQKQVQLAFDNLAAVLKAAGAGFDDVIDVTTFHTDPENQFAAINEVRLKAFGEAPYPNWTAVGVNWLAGFDFEIKVIARIPSSAAA